MRYFNFLVFNIFMNVLFQSVVSFMIYAEHFLFPIIKKYQELVSKEKFFILLWLPFCQLLGINTSYKYKNMYVVLSLYHMQLNI